MANPSITWRPIPPELRAALEPHVMNWLPALPGWVSELHIGTIRRDDSDDGTSVILTTTVQPEYRNLALRVSPELFLEQTVADRSDCVLHEFVHVPVAQLHDTWLSLMEAVGPELDERLKAWATEQWRLAMEATVCDLTATLIAVADPSYLGDQ